MPTMYLLGGNGSASDWWLDALPHFERYRAVPVELPGFGDNPEPPCADIASYAEALMAITAPGSAIFAVGVNALVVMHALQRRPGHFSRIVLLAPVGAFLWRRRLPALMSSRVVRRIAHRILAHRPQWLRRKFTTQKWMPEQFDRIARGYARCRAFLPYWDMVRPDNALALLEWIRDPIELVWGDHDAVLAPSQAAAWSAILARAELEVCIKEGWGHFPWIDSPEQFVAWLESGHRGFYAHGKAGRLELARLAGLPVPTALTVVSSSDRRLEALLAEPAAQWAVRSSHRHEDQADPSNAGRSLTWLRQPAAAVRERIAELLRSGSQEVVVQRFVEPLLSGIAFVRNLAVEVEWIEGHLEALADGRATPQRAVISSLQGEWNVGRLEPGHGLEATELQAFLLQVLHCFHYVHGDVEWAWDGQQLWLLQYRPVTEYGWRRHLTDANIAEILPARPSRLVEYAQRRASNSIPAVMARWDTRVLEDNEPFTARFGDASYINNDLFLARLADWGLASSRYSREVGGGTPELKGSLMRFMRSLPVFIRMLVQSRDAILALEAQLSRFDRELERLVAAKTNGQELSDWFVRFYLFVVQSNLLIATALASSGGSWLGMPGTAYRDDRLKPHRLPWESDPATPRSALQDLPLSTFPAWSSGVRLAHRLGVPGMRGHYLQVREWFRDNLMRIFFRVHHAMPAEERLYWFDEHPSARERQGCFWQDGSVSNQASAGFVIYPGEVEGVLGQDILLERALDPGRYEHYRRASGVIALLGGRLSHGATLLRELRKPSAVLPGIDSSLVGRRILLKDGVVTLVK